MKRKNILFRNSLHLALLGPVLALGAPGMAIADNASSDTQQDENLPAGEPGDPIELDPIVAIGRMPPSTVVLGREVDTPSNRHLKNVLKGMPNILDNSGLGNDLPTMRGIEGDAGMGASQTGWTGAQPRVNTLVDGVARPFKFGSSISSQSGVWDVEAVEVAKGPQMTSTGRSSLSGAVHVSTRNPVHEREFALRAGGFTEWGTREGAAMVNLPLVEDQVALRFASEVSDGKPYVKFTNDVLSDEFNKERYEHYRGKLLLTPDALPDTEFLFTIENTRVHKPSPPSLVDPYAKDLVRNLESAWTGFAETDQKVYSAKLLQRLGEKADLEIRVSHLDNYLDYDPTSYLQANPSNPQWFDVETKTTSAEALLHFEELGFVDKGLVGVAYEYQDDWITRADYTLTNGEKDNYAVFGEIEAGFLGSWTAIAGGRFERDDRRRDNRAKRTDTFQKQEWSGNGFSPKLGIRYDGADNFVAGYTYSEGWRPGGLDFHMQGGQTTTFDEERLKNHEIWVRGNPLGRLSLNGSLFYYVFDDMQLRWDNLNRNPVCGWSATATCLVGNIPEAKGYGMELDGQFAINDAWRLSGGLGLLDTEVTDAGSDVPVYQGHELSQSPSLTWNTGLGWVSPRGFDAEISARYVGSFRKSYHVPNDDAPSYTLVDFSAGYETKLDGTNVRIDAWVENLMDKRYILPMAYSSKGGGKGIPGRPRTFGVAVTARF